MAEPRVSIVVCTMPSRGEDLARCAGSVAALDGAGGAEVVLVSMEGEPLPAPDFGGVRVRSAVAKTRGLSDKRNRGIAAARGEFVAYLDDDARPRRDWLERLLATFDAGADAVAGGVEPAFDVPVSAVLSDVIFQIGGFNRFDGAERRDGFIGANCAFRREFLASLGPFDTRLGPGSTWLPWGDDSEMFRRARGRGRIVFAPDATVDHRIQRERISVDYVLRRATNGGRTLCVIDAMHEPRYLRTRFLIPVYLARAALECARAPAGLAAKVRRNRLAGYFVQSAFLAAKGMPPRDAGEGRR